MDRRELRGGCHCGAVALRLEWPEREPFVARACGCTFCRERSATWTSHTDARLELRLPTQDACSRYRFGTETADFFICRNCGSVLVAACEIAGRLYAVVNVKTLRGDGDPATEVRPTDFDDETTEDRLTRRRHSWVPEVQISVG